MGPKADLEAVEYRKIYVACRESNRPVSEVEDVGATLPFPDMSSWRNA
jgi:hypothetical protein